MGCGLSRTHAQPEVLVSHGNARTDIPWPVADRPTSPGGMAEGAHRGGDGDLSQVREDVAGPVRCRRRAGLHDRSSRPHSLPTRTSADTRGTQIVAICAGESVAGRTAIGAELGVPARTVSRMLARHHMPHAGARWTRSPAQMIRASKTTAVRYERDRPGELVHMDVKKIGRIPDGGGWRAHGRAAAESTRDRSTKVGFDYVALPGRRPLPAGLLRDPARREGHRPALRSWPGPSAYFAATASPASSG